MSSTVMTLRDMVLGDKLLKSLLVWELSAKNELTDALCESREKIGLHALLALVTAGVYYLTLRADTVPVFNGIDIQMSRPA